MKKIGTISLQSKILLVFCLLVVINVFGWVYYTHHIELTVASSEVAQKSYGDVLVIAHAFQTASDQMKVYMRNQDYASFVVYQESSQLVRENLPKLQESTNLSGEQAMIRRINNAVEATFEAYDSASYDYQNSIPYYFFDYYYGNKITEYGLFYIDDYLNFLLDAHTTQAEALRQQTNLAFYTAQSILLFCGCLYFILAIVLSRWITEPIRNLVGAAQKISQGNYDFEDLPIRHEDEIGTLTATFNVMKEDISQAIEFLLERVEVEKKLRDAKIKEVESSKLLKEAQYLALQSQMNPHFLFNTLNAISRTIEYESKEVAINLVHSLATICRYNLDHVSSYSTVEQELYVTKQYIYIQQHRFDERIKYVVDCEESCKKVLVPSLLVQPLVENALKHGIENMVSGGMIYVKITRKEGHVCLRVYDNGAGVDKERLAQLSKGVHEDFTGHTTGIGLGNIVKRIEMTENSRIIVRSSSTKGTLVKIFMPV